MTEKNVTSSSAGIGFSSLLTIVFIVLKLMKVITWAWIWVLSPTWIVIALWVLFIVAVIVIASKN